MSADVMIAVLQTALLGFFRDFTTSEITSPLFIKIREIIIKDERRNSNEILFFTQNILNKSELTAVQAWLPCETEIIDVHC